MTKLYARASGLLLAASTLVLAACTNITLPPNAETTVPVVDASIRPDGTTAAPASAASTPAPTGTAASGPLNGLHLQAGTFSSQANADKAAATLRNKVPSLSAKVFVAPRGANFRVLVGPFANEQERAAAAGTLRTGSGSEVVNAAP